MSLAIGSLWVHPTDFAPVKITRCLSLQLNHAVLCCATLRCSYGKTSTAWLARGMFEEMNELCGMTGAPA